MRSAKSKAPVRPARLRVKVAASTPANQHAEELMALAVDAAQSRHLPDFLHRFAERSAHMLQALWGGVAVFRGRETDLYAGSANVRRETSGQDEWLFACAREHRGSVEVRALYREQAASFLPLTSEPPA